jgi:hypothetical protein
MTTATIPFESDSTQNLWDRLLADFPASVEEWSRSINGWNRWEEEHLLVERPSREDLAHHLKFIKRLMFFGQLFALVATHPEYGDAQTAEMVNASQEVLRNKLRMFHQPMDSEEAEKILAEVFPAS